MTFKAIRILAAAFLILALPAIAQAQFFYRSDGGYLEFQVDRNAKVKKQKIFWAWSPHYPAGSVTYEIYAWCTRQDAEENFYGKNKVTFSGIKLIGDSAQLGVGGKLTRKLRNGETGLLSKEISTAGILAASNTSVVGEATVLVKGTLVAGDRIFCAIDVTETPPG